MLINPFMEFASRIPTVGGGAVKDLPSTPKV